MKRNSVNKERFDNGICFLIVVGQNIVYWQEILLHSDRVGKAFFTNTRITGEPQKLGRHSLQQSH